MTGHYDAMTGEFIPDKEDQEEKFDPMTGQPIQGTYGPQDDYDVITMTLKKTPNQKKPKSKLVLAYVAAILVVIAIVITNIVRSGAFLSDKQKISLACKNSIKLSSFGETLNIYDQVLDGSYGISANVKTNDYNGEVSFYVDTEHKKRYCNATFDVEGVNIDATALLNDKEVLVKIPVLSDNIFMYNYVEEKNGVLSDVMKEAGIDLHEVDQFISSCMNDMKLKKLQEELKKEVKQVIDRVEVKECEGVTCIVDGGEKTTKEYQVVLTSKDMMDLCEAYHNVIGKYSNELSQNVSKISGDYNDFNMDPTYDELMNELKDMKDVKIHFFLYQNQVAKIELNTKTIDDSRKEKDLNIVFEFLGGENPSSNMRITADYDLDKTVIEKKTNKTGSVEVTQYMVNSNTILEIEYDTKSGEYLLDAGNAFDSSFYMKGKLNREKSDVTFTIDELESDGQKENISLELKYTNSVKIPELEGEKLDLGNMSQGQFYDLYLEIVEKLQFFGSGSMGLY